jgi:tetratricopeptide (TPR) repeat protein
MAPTDDLDAHFADLLRSAAVWQPAETPAVAPPARIRELSSLATRLNEEERASAELLESLANTPVAWWRTAILKSGSGRTAGMVRQLLERMRTVIRKTPAHALEITTLAVDIANDLSFCLYPSDFVISLRGDAWRDHAYVLQFLGRFPEALQAVDEAEQLFAQTVMPAFPIARVKLVRANILRSIDRLPEAIALAHEAGETFLDFGEQAKYINARVTEAAVLYQHGCTREALSIWESLKDDEAIEEVTRLIVISNMGLAYREVGEPEKSVEFLTLAIAEYEILGMAAEAARGRWGLATTLVSAGRMSASIPIFERSWKEFEALEMEADAALVALELAEVLLVCGMSDRVPQICRTLLDRFTRAGMTSRAITALSYLREVVAIGKAQPPIVRHVREFLRDLPSQGRLSLSIDNRER